MKKKWITTVALMLCLSLLPACGTPEESRETEDGTLRIVATVFPAYDLARAVAGENAKVELLLPPGAESHSYEPTPADMLSVGDCDLFLYLGGAGDTWVDTLLSSVELKGETMKMVDCVDLLEEETVEGMEHDHDHDYDHDHDLGAVKEYDEHVWTSPRNAAEITRAIGAKLAELDAQNAETYTANAEDYAAQIDALDGEFRDFFDGVSNKTMLFGDRFPLRYFAAEYDIPYFAAFPGCSTQTEPSAATVAFLMEKAKQEHLDTIYYIEFSNHLVADSIAESVGAQTAMFHTCHNVSQKEMDEGATYLSLMQGNLETLKQTMH